MIAKYAQAFQFITNKIKTQNKNLKRRFDIIMKLMDIMNINYELIINLKYFT